MARIGVINNYSSIKHALYMKNDCPLWIVMGQQEAWTNEASPPSPTPGNAAVVQPIVAIRTTISSVASIVSQDVYNGLSDPNRAVVIIGASTVYLQLVADADAYSASAMYLWLEAMYDPIIQGMPSFSTFRTYYVVSGLIPAAGYETALWLAPTNITSYGNIEYENAGTAINGGSAINIPVLLQFT